MLGIWSTTRTKLSTALSTRALLIPSWYRLLDVVRDILEAEFEEDAEGGVEGAQEQGSLHLHQLR